MNRMICAVVTKPNYPRKITYCALALSALTSFHPSFALSSGFPQRSSFSSSSQTCLANNGAMEIVQLPCLSDNYGYLLHDTETGCTAAVDTPEAKPYQEELNKRGWKLTHIFNTHHHWDHTGANQDLKTPRVQVVGPIHEKEKIPLIDSAVGHGDVVQFGSTKAIVMDVGGHTKGHIAYYFPDSKSVFVGDSLFALGCGRMFEGTPEQFWASLTRLRDLPDDTTVYCAHEYTEANAKFAMSVEPNNSDLVARAAIIKQKRARGEPTVPFNLGDEKKTNPFLRCDISAELRASVGVNEADSDAAAFGKVRKAKDNFRG